MSSPWSLLLILLCLVSGCAQPSTPQPPPSPTAISFQPAPQSLRALAQSHHILIGSAVNMDALQSDSRYASTLAHEFALVTPENVLKFDVVHPAKDRYDFSQADTLLAFAQAHQMQMRGHTLVWHQALPTWLTGSSFTHDQLQAILKDHITTVMSHYRGKITSWDVVNEAIDDGINDLRASLWQRILGPDYIDEAFRWAHEADPQAHLFYNDYSGEGLGAKSDAIYNLLKGMLQRGVPIYGVGLQMHLSITSAPSAQDVQKNMQRLAALGLKVQITEMDVQTWQSTATPTQKEAAQADLYRSMLSTCLAVPACEAFILWGFTDHFTWITLSLHHQDTPLIFDTEYRPKKAYYALIQALTTSS